MLHYVNMKPSVLIILLCVGLAGRINSQTTTWKWGTAHCVLNATDSLFLVNTELAMWRHERANNSFVLYEGFHGSGGYRVRVSKFGMEITLADSNVAKLRFSRIAELLTVWDIDADTCWIIGFEPMVIIKRSYRWSNSPSWYDTTCYVHIPLFTYKSILGESAMLRLRQLTISHLAGQFNGSTSGDTIYRIVRFKSDSNEYLPQARYKHMGEIMENGMFAGQLGVYRDRELSVRMSKRELEESFARWDSANKVEDPNNRGHYILAPIKVQQFPAGIVIYEKWIPSDCESENHEFPNYRPQPYLRFNRVVMAYGLLLTDGRINWVSPQHFDTWFSTATFNREPYEESFRAERFERMHIALEP